MVYLAQTDDPQLEKQARESAKKLGLDIVVLRTGYGDFETEIISLQNTHKESQLSKSTKE